MIQAGESQDDGLTFIPNRYPVLGSVARERLQANGFSCALMAG
jgi:hypothetical protein